MTYYSFNLLCAVREAVERLDGEFTYHEVLRLVREEHPEFGAAAGGYIVSNYLSALLKEGSIVRVKYADRKAPPRACTGTQSARVRVPRAPSPELERDL